MDELDSHHDDLKTILTSLRSDPEAIVVEARSLGLFRKNQSVAYFNTRDVVKPRYDAGSVLRLNPLLKRDNDFLRIASLVAGILVILISLVRWRLTDATHQK